MSAAEVRDHLERAPRQLPSKYFYDELGSALFEAICRLPWYSITRAETALLAAHAAALVRPLRRPVQVTELGCGDGSKLALFLSAAGLQSAHVQLIDVSVAALDAARRRLREIGCRSVWTHPHTYEEGLRRAAVRRRTGTHVVLFLGSNIGNFEPAEARALLASIRRILLPGDAFVLGCDLVKPESDLLLAYDDPLGVTAAFNKNLLRRINDELGGDFDLERFAHRARWNRDEERVEMHLVSEVRQRVAIAAARYAVELAAGEAIHTESSYKYRPERIVDEGARAGFGPAEQWIHAAARFALTRFTV
jgi:dimethylhistidine N-methyltransferase